MEPTPGEENWAPLGWVILAVAVIPLALVVSAVVMAAVSLDGCGDITAVVALITVPFAALAMRMWQAAVLLGAADWVVIFVLSMVRTRRPHSTESGGVAEQNVLSISATVAVTLAALVVLAVLVAAICLVGWAFLWE